MKIYVWIFSFIFICLLSGCNDIPDIPDERAFNDKWVITINGISQATAITANSNTISMFSMNFSGNWSVDTFTGTYVRNYANGRYIYELHLTVESHMQISGNFITTLMNYRRSIPDTVHFTGKRADHLN